MVFTLNTTVFAEEVAVDSVDDAVEATVDAVDEVAEEATVDAVVDADDTTVAADSDVEENNGIKTSTKDGKAVTTIKFDSNGAKKNEKFDVCTITNTTNPTSWNNVYARNLIATVLYGEYGKDEWLNNGSPVTVSSNSNVANIEGLVVENEVTYKVIPVVEGSQYIFVGYGLTGPETYNNNRWHYTRDFVAGVSTVEKTTGELTALQTIPVTTWDGRQVDFNKSGNYKYTNGKRESLDVAVAFVTYENGVVKEINGVDAGSVKVDKKNQKAASVEFDTFAKGETIVVPDGDKTKSATRGYKEHKTLGDLPYFTIKPSVKGNDAKSYKKDIANKLKDVKFYFGIVQKPVDVESDLTAVNTAYKDQYYAAAGLDPDTDTVSEDDLKKVSQDNVDKAEAAIAATLTNSAYFNTDEDSIDFDDFTITKFNDKGATITLKGYVGDTKNNYEWSSLKAISGKGKDAEYSFEDGTVANTTVKVLKFTDGGNFVYRPMELTVNTDADGKVTSTRTWTDTDQLAPIGFKWAFRKSPEEKSKKFRYGVFKENGQGFVYSVDETAVDSVEEAF